MSIDLSTLGIPFTSIGREAVIPALGLPILSAPATTVPSFDPLPDNLCEADVAYFADVCLTAVTAGMATLKEVVFYSFHRLGVEHDFAYKQRDLCLNMIADEEDASTNDFTFTCVDDGLRTFLGRENGIPSAFAEAKWRDVVHRDIIHRRAGKLRGFLSNDPAGARDLAAAILPRMR